MTSPRPLTDSDLDRIDSCLGGGRVSPEQGADVILCSDLTAEIRRLRALVDGQPAPDTDHGVQLFHPGCDECKRVARILTGRPTPPSAELEWQRGYGAGWHAGRREALAQGGPATPGPTRDEEAYLPATRDVGEFVRSLALPTRDQVWDAVLEVHRAHCSWPDSMTEAMVSETTDAVLALFGRSAPEPPATIEGSDRAD